MSHLTDTAVAIQSHRELAVYQVLAPFDGPVLIAGAYKGDATRAMRVFDEHADVHAFEPQSHCWPDLEALGREMPFTLHRVALGVEDAEITLHGPGTDACSILDERQPGTEQATMVDAATYLERINPGNRWAAWALNMEGYEYKLLPYASQYGLLDGVKNLVVQFHPGVVTDPDPTLLPGGLYVPKGYTVMWNRFPTWVWMARRG